MTKSRFYKFGLGEILLGAALLCAVMVSPPASAQTVGRNDNYRDRGMQQATAASTFATTSYADLPGTTLTFTPTRDPTQVDAPGTTQPAVRMQVDWSLDVIKATATTGTCGVFANGALIATSARSIDFAAKQGTIGGTFEVTLTGAGSQVAKLQCKSGDTNILTVNLGQVNFIEIY